MAYTTALMRSMAASRAKALVAVCGGVVLDAAQVESGLAVNAGQSVQVDHASG